MTAANVAVSPKVGRASGPGPFVAVLLVVSLVAGFAIGALAVRAVTTTQAVTPAVGVTTSQPRVGPMAPKAAAAAAVRAEAAAAAAAEASFANYSRIVAGLSAAESRHDYATKARFSSQLEVTLTAETIGLVYQEHARLQQALEDALAAGNGYAMFRITQDLDALCGPAAVKASLSFC